MALQRAASAFVPACPVAETSAGARSFYIFSTATRKGTLLRKHWTPVLHNGEELGKKAHRASGLSEKVFFSGRRKRSPRATFKRRDQAFAVHGDAELRLDAFENCGDMQRGPGPFEYVERHINLRPILAAARLGGGGLAVTEAANGVTGISTLKRAPRKKDHA